MPNRSALRWVSDKVDSLVAGGIGKVWDELEHPRGPDGRFIKKWGMPEETAKSVGNFLWQANPRTFPNNAAAGQWAFNQHHKHTDSSWSPQEFLADWQDTNDQLRAGQMDQSTKDYVDMMDRNMVELDQTTIGSISLPPEAFGLTHDDLVRKPVSADPGEEPHLLSGVDMLTGRLLADRGYTSTVVGDPVSNPTGTPGQVDPRRPITLAIMVPKGSKAVFPGSNASDRRMVLDRDQELRITHVEQHPGGYFVYAVATPRTPGKTPEPLHQGAGGDRISDVITKGAYRPDVDILDHVDLEKGTVPNAASGRRLQRLARTLGVDAEGTDVQIRRRIVQAARAEKKSRDKGNKPNATRPIVRPEHQAVPAPQQAAPTPAPQAAPAAPRAQRPAIGNGEGLMVRSEQLARPAGGAPAAPQRVQPPEVHEGNTEGTVDSQTFWDRIATEGDWFPPSSGARRREVQDIEKGMKSGKITPGQALRNLEADISANRADLEDDPSDRRLARDIDSQDRLADHLSRTYGIPRRSDEDFPTPTSEQMDRPRDATPLPVDETPTKPVSERPTTRERHEQLKAEQQKPESPKVKSNPTDRERHAKNVEEPRTEQPERKPAPGPVQEKLDRRTTTKEEARQALETNRAKREAERGAETPEERQQRLSDEQDAKLAEQGLHRRTREEIEADKAAKAAEEEGSDGETAKKPRTPAAGRKATKELKEGDRILAVKGQDGEWKTTARRTGKGVTPILVQSASSEKVRNEKTGRNITRWNVEGEDADGNKVTIRGLTSTSSFWNADAPEAQGKTKASTGDADLKGTKADLLEIAAKEGVSVKKTALKKDIEQAIRTNRRNKAEGAAPEVEPPVIPKGEQKIISGEAPAPLTDAERDALKAKVRARQVKTPEQKAEAEKKIQERIAKRRSPVSKGPEDTELAKGFKAEQARQRAKAETPQLVEVAGQKTVVAPKTEAPAKGDKFLRPLADGTLRKSATNLKPGDVIFKKGTYGYPEGTVESIEHRGKYLIDVHLTDGRKFTGNNSNTVFHLKPPAAAAPEAPAAPAKAAPSAGRAPAISVSRVNTTRLKPGDVILAEERDGKLHPTERKTGVKRITVTSVDRSGSERGFNRTTNLHFIHGTDEDGNPVRLDRGNDRGFPPVQRWNKLETGAEAPSPAKAAKKAVAKAAPAKAAELPSAPRATEAMSPGRVRDFEDAFDKENFNVPDETARGSLDEIRAELATGKITPDQGVQRLESEIEFLGSEAADIDADMRRNGKTADQLKRLRDVNKSYADMKRASVWMRRHFNREPEITPGEVKEAQRTIEVEVDPEAFKLLNDATPEQMREAGRLAGLDLKGESKDDLFQDFARQFLQRELDRKKGKAPKVPAKAVPKKVEAPEQEPGKAWNAPQVREVGAGLDISDRWLDSVQKDLDNPKVTPAQAGRNLEKRLNSVGAPAVQAAVLWGLQGPSSRTPDAPDNFRNPNSPIYSPERIAQVDAEHAELMRQHGQLQQLADRLKKTRRSRLTAPRPEPEKLDTTESADAKHIADVTGLPEATVAKKMVTTKEDKAVPSEWARGQADLVNAAGSDEEVDAILKGKTAAEMKQISRAVTGNPGSSKADAMLRIKNHTAGKRTYGTPLSEKPTLHSSDAAQKEHDLRASEVSIGRTQPVAVVPKEELTTPKAPVKKAAKKAAPKLTDLTPAEREDYEARREQGLGHDEAMFLAKGNTNPMKRAGAPAAAPAPAKKAAKAAAPTLPTRTPGTPNNPETEARRNKFRGIRGDVRQHGHTRVASDSLTQAENDYANGEPPDRIATTLRTQAATLRGKTLPQSGMNGSDKKTTNERRSLQNQDADALIRIADELDPKGKKETPTVSGPEAPSRDPKDILKRLSDFDNPPSRQEAHAELKGLNKSQLQGMAKDLSIPGASKKTMDDLRRDIVESTAGRRLDSIATRGFRGVTPGTADQPKFSDKPILENTWGGRTSPVHYHADGVIGQLVQRDLTSDERRLNVDGEPLENALGMAATDQVMGRITPEELNKRIRAIADKLPVDARVKVERAADALGSTKGHTINIPDGTPEPLRQLARDLEAIPLSNGTNGQYRGGRGRETAELDGLEELIKEIQNGDWDGRSSAIFADRLMSKTHNKRHESQEGKMEIDRAVVKAMKAMEALPGRKMPRVKESKAESGGKLTIADVQNLNISQLRDLATKRGIKGAADMGKDALLDALVPE